MMYYVNTENRVSMLRIFLNYLHAYLSNLLTMYAMLVQAKDWTMVMQFAQFHAKGATISMIYVSMQLAKETSSWQRMKLKSAKGSKRECVIPELYGGPLQSWFGSELCNFGLNSSPVYVAYK